MVQNYEKKKQTRQVICDALMAGHVPDAIRQRDPEERAKMLAPVIAAAPTLARNAKQTPKTPHPVPRPITSAHRSVKTEATPLSVKTETKTPHTVAQPAAGYPYPLQTPTSPSLARGSSTSIPHLPTPARRPLVIHEISSDEDDEEADSSDQRVTSDAAASGGPPYTQIEPASAKPAPPTRRFAPRNAAKSARTISPTISESSFVLKKSATVTTSYSKHEP
jgi:hypothetical protein